MPRAIELRPVQVFAIALTLALGLAVDVRTDLFGQALIGVAVWAFMLVLLARFPAHERYVFIACLAIATTGELVLSLGWGLYTYRLGNVPPFVPPGHVMLLMLGVWLAHRITDRTAQLVVACAGIYAGVAALAGIDTLGMLLFLVIAIAWFLVPTHRRLYASTFAVALVLEIYGTWLEVWRWATDVPGLPLVTTNPPGTVGAFYCALDALVMTAMLLVLPQIRRSYAAAKAV